MQTRTTVQLPGSERSIPRGSRLKGPVNGDDSVEVRITLNAPATLKQKFDEIAAQPVAKRKYMSRDEYESSLSVDQSSIQKIEQFAREHNLSVSRTEPAWHTVHLQGTVRDMSLAFQTYLESYELPDGTSCRVRTGPIHIPQELSGIVLSVNGLDERPVASPKVRLRPKTDPDTAQSVNYTPQEVASLYSFPQVPNPGSGQTIGIIELGGGFRQADLDKYFQGKAPSVTAVAVDNGHNKPTGKPDGPDGEVMLDIEVAGAVASGSNIAVYFAPNTNKGFLDSISTAIHDSARNPSIISISWGGPEDGGGYTPSVLSSFEQSFQAAGVLGITVLVAAGDNGSGDSLPSGNHVDFPAASPLVTACGGTRMLAPDKKKIQSETVWNDGATGGATGGGVSKVFPVPSYQSGLKATQTNGSKPVLTGRGVPDIAANADPVTGYDVLVDGQSIPIGGTSAVAPLVSGLVAILNQQIGKPVGFLNPSLYRLAGSPALRDITVGNNGTYAAAIGWDACTGLGAPVGTALLSALK